MEYAVLEKICFLQTKKAYEKASEEAEVAQVNHDKGDKDQNMTKAKMDKLVTILRTKNNHAEECRNNYLLFLEETNKKQDLHYTSQMPEVMTVSACYSYCILYTHTYIYTLY